MGIIHLTYKIELLNNNVWEELKSVVVPFFYTTTLDESLDSGNFKLSLSRDLGRKLRPFKRLRITVFEYKNSEVAAQVIHCLVSSYKKIRRTFPNGKTFYDYEIQTIELTKLLEREVCDSMTVTKYLGHDFSGTAVKVVPTLSGWVSQSEISLNAPTFYSPTPLAASKFLCAVKDVIKLPVLSVMSTGNIKFEEIGGGTTTLVNNKDDGYNLILSNEGSYRVIYTGTYDAPSPPYSRTFTITYTFEVTDSGSIIPDRDKSITDVVNRLLSAGVTRRSGIETQKYVFDSAQATKYAEVLAPEFYFTRSTLFEALLQVGAYIHAIPRLTDVDGVLTVVFDELGGSEVKEIRNPYYYDDCQLGIDDYCGTLDSHAENLLNTRDKEQGAIAEPSAGAYKTIRCEESKTVIDADSMIVLTEFPIYQVTKLEVSFEWYGNIRQYDITPYLYEAAEYRLLSSYDGSAYPNSKAWALSYSQGGNKISGLNFKQSAKFDTTTAWGKIAIRNIIKAVSGDDIEAIHNYTTLAFRVTYIPIISARITQKKNALGYPLDNTLINNQGTNTVENEYYGEKMKGTIARIGNEVVRRTYYFLRINEIPKVGELVDIDGVKMYVAEVTHQYDSLAVRVTITFTPNFNRLAEYVALDSNYRLYDISEKQSVDRFVNYSECILVGDEADIPYTIPTSNVKELIKLALFKDTVDQSLSGNIYVNGEITAVIAEMAGKKVARPVISYASGNSICFTFDFADNFGAGYQSVNPYTEGSVYKRIQKLVSYTDNFGEFDTLGLTFVNKLWTAAVTDQTSDTGNAQIYPQFTAEMETVEMEDSAFSTKPYIHASTDCPLIIQKDSREALRVTVQIHFVATSEKYVIGSALARNHPYVRPVNLERAAKAYFLPYRLNALNDTINLDGAVAVSMAWGGTSGRVQVGQLVGTTENMAAWALIDPTDNKLLVGRNNDGNGFSTSSSRAVKWYDTNNNILKDIQEVV